MLLQQADDRVSIEKDWFKDYHFHLVKNIDQFKKLVDICIDRGICSLDVESTGIDNRIYKDEFFEDGIKTKYGVRTIDHIVGLCISFDGEHGYYVPLRHEPEDSENLPWDPVCDELTRLVYNCKIIFHHGKYDKEMLIPMTGKDYYKVDENEDTMLLVRVINPLKSYPAGLKPLTKIHFGVDMIELDELFTPERKEQLLKEKKKYNFGLLHPKEGLAYGCSDGIFTYKLWFALKDKLQGNDLTIYNIEKSFCNVVQIMERNRVHIDIDRVKQLAEECNEELKNTGDAIREIIESKTGKTGKWLTLNVGSPKQLSAAFITDPEGLLLKPTKMMLGEEDGQDLLSGDDDDDDDGDGDDSEKQYSLKDEAIKSLDAVYRDKFLYERKGVVGKDGLPKKESIFDLILEYRHYTKMKGSFIDKFMLSHDKYGDVRPIFNQMGTDTTRLSSRAGKISDGFSGINFQGIPRDSDEDKPELFKQIRTCIIPRPGWFLVKLDYAGEELRVVTNLSGDPIWTKSFLYEDGDVHSITSRTLFDKSEVNKDERNRGKRCNFAFIYGGGAGAISRNIGCSFEDANKHMANLRASVPVLMGYVEHQKDFARKNKCIITAFGRRIPIPTIDSPIKAIRAKAERCAINYTIQASSADVIKLAMCLVDKRIREHGWEDKVKYVMTVHDEVVYEVRPEVLMEAVRKLDEWMTFPWKIPKAHGLDWKVPLMTEPGVDINWKARFDYFKMVDGVQVSPDSIVDGIYKGKLKKDEYYDNGKVYQKVPDFLKGFLSRVDGGELQYQEVKTGGLPQKSQLKSVEVEEPKPEREEIEEVIKFDDFEISDSDSLGLDTLSPESPPVAEVIQKSEVKSPPVTEVIQKSEVKSPPVAVQKSESRVEPSLKSEIPPKLSPQVLEKKPTTDVSIEVFRWVFMSVPSENSMRKLHAICILSEGTTPIRIVGKKGDILVNESEGILIDPMKFKVLVDLFGL